MHRERRKPEEEQQGSGRAPTAGMREGQAAGSGTGSRARSPLCTRQGPTAPAPASLEGAPGPRRPARRGMTPKDLTSKAGRSKRKTACRALLCSEELQNAAALSPLPQEGASPSTPPNTRRPAAARPLSADGLRERGSLLQTDLHVRKRAGGSPWPRRRRCPPLPPCGDPGAGALEEAPGLQIVSTPPLPHLHYLIVPL